MTAAVWDDTPCALGEGPLWHSTRNQLFWFDIIRFRLHSREAGESRTWQFDEHVSAGGWVDETRLLIASETGLSVFDIETGDRAPLASCEADRPDTRSNDGRADPQGGFWFGTMGKAAQPGMGAIYRWYRGELRTLHNGITIPNAICFAPDGRTGYFADTARKTVWCQDLDADGWPSGEARVFLDLTADGLNPDGAVTDAHGNLWLALWGASGVACYAPDARFLRKIAIPARHTSCPAFGGRDLTTLYCTTARQGLSAETLAAEPENGMTFAAPDAGRGRPEPKVIL